MAGEWIDVDPAELAGGITNGVVSKRVNNVMVTVMPSPHDLPGAYRGFYDQARNRFVFEFQYLGEEKTAIEPHGPSVALRVGRNSGRVYAIELDTNVQGQWLPLIQKALSDRARDTQKPRRPANYEATRRLVNEHFMQQRVPELAEATT